MRLPFELDPRIIHHIIYSQAGSIGKAIIELVMNSIDAGATSVTLNISSAGFSCHDDGAGFASREDVLRYFGRFGTPHQEGDATYGRFRLGRGQIMAHARTSWRSRRWQMAVDTREMGYNYELVEPGDDQNGCAISGEWYEPLNSQERMSCIQEIRDLVRYTPVTVHLNGTVITRLPALEKWDLEDDEAWYRLREDGAVSVYNQGVLVRHDPAHVWGVGGLIVSKRPLALNVSRTEILRKTCPVWKSIAARFGRLAATFSDHQGKHRKTEARREKTARSLLSGEGDMQSLFNGEEAITLLPGKQHVTLEHFIRKCCHYPSAVDKNCFTLIRYAGEVPRGELIARAGIAPVVHPITLSRFGCYEPEEFMECLSRVRENLMAYREHLPREQRWGSGWQSELALVDFETLSANFIDCTQMVSEKQLDKETRRAWTALRWCLAEYAAVCSGGGAGYQSRAYGGIRFQILLGESTSSDAWTDGETYIAYNIDIVRRLKSDALCTASQLFSLTEHEVAHEGDSLDCGHDEAFYQRFHDISTLCAPDRQRYMHVWLMKYTTSLEAGGKRATGTAWRERYLTDRASTGREKKGLPGIIIDEGLSEAVSAQPAPEDAARLSFLNQQLNGAGTSAPAETDWNSVVAAGIEQTRVNQAIRGQQQKELEEWYASDEYVTGMLTDEQRAAEDEEQMWLESRKLYYLSILPGVTEENLNDSALKFLAYMTDSEEEELAAWGMRAWENSDQWYARNTPSYSKADFLYEQDFDQSLEKNVPADWHPFMQEGETRWSIERNAAAAGFMREMDYLLWRKKNEA
ncbi:DNA mismatch repair protein MutL [Kosakonia radicincitans UMEnt01/12]|uniref:ATP-binding protein n=1 Tax=Kosakonia radicincitans TaxID=283686 RepID=UPI000461B527|nr:ATP-binding protein [Kosakonia radicincitans]KDE34197.1 DNA mismatch repair protein MutL [Kosakonia radicincitans UMEnt01/12]